MNREQLIAEIKRKKSYLCVGLDPDIKKIPTHLQKEKDPIFEFNRRIIDATADYTVAYKPNIAFYECLGAKGWESLEKTINYIPKNIFTIADAKRGDIGNTSTMYAQAFFENMNFDSVTVAPYMGADSVKPFTAFKDKWVILLALTSNEGSADFQTLLTEDGETLFSKVIQKSQEWATDRQLMYVVGATKAEKLREIRRIAATHFLLIPGVGAQGGSLQDVSNYGLIDDIGLLVNLSRNIIYASSGEDFAQKAGEKAKEIQIQMQGYLTQKALL
jgi:orotidine-5'-phosphate decarboxylase